MIKKEKVIPFIKNALEEDIREGDHSSLACIPNNKIGINHLAGGIKVDGKDMRTDKTVLIDIKDAEGNIIKKSLRIYQSF